MLLLIFILNKLIFVYGLSCSQILELPLGRRLTLTELQTVPPAETVKCTAHLGKEQIPMEEAEYLWQSIITFHKGIERIPDKVLMLLHWITPALTPSDYENLTISNIDVVQNFGLNYGLTDDQLSAIADRVRTDFAEKDPEDYTFYDVTALRQILCAFNQSEIERIHPSVYREASLTIGRLENCREDVMRGFANLAVQPTGFGPRSQWSQATIQSIGKVAQYVPSTGSKSKI